MGEEKPFRVCPLCGEAGARELYRFEPALWIPGRVVRCERCSGVYKKPADDAKPIAEYYRDPRYHELDYWSYEKHAERALRRICNALVSVLAAAKGLSLLEVGCGPGQFLQLAQEAGFEVAGVELNEGNAAEARKRTGGAPVLCEDFMTAGFDRQFDVIALLDLIEHMPDPRATLLRCYELLKPGGHVVVYTPNHGGITVKAANLLYRVSGGRIAGPVTEIFDCLHVVFFDVNSLRSTLERSDFRVVRTVLSAYDPARNGQATGVSAWGVRGLEAAGAVLFGQFRMLMFARK
jgi:2-polyprenyl-3-methyl-5-hydroxy-6-metoxy-1,4-benzoquinol methylase